MVELALTGDIAVGFHSPIGKPERLNDYAAFLGVDHAALRAQVTAETKAKIKAKAAPAKETKGVIRETKAAPSETKAAPKKRKAKPAAIFV